MRLSDILEQKNRSATLRDSPWADDVWGGDPWGRNGLNDQPKPTEPEPQPSRTRNAAQGEEERTTSHPPKPHPAVTVQAKGAAPLVLPPPVRQLPAAWGLEVQRIAHRLAFGQPQAPQVVLFVAPIPQSGVSTLSYLIAHHLASSAREGRTLLLTLTPAAEHAPREAFTLPIGAPFSWTQLPADHALNRLTLFGGSEFSVAEKVRWFRSLITTARGIYATIVVDVPPLNRSADGYLIAQESDGVVLVLKSGEVRKPAVAALTRELQSMGTPVLGGVLTFRRYPLPQWLIRLL